MEIAGFEALYPEAIIILEAAVLFEAGWEDIGEEVWVVVADREVAIDRAMSRDGASRAAVEQRLNAQLSNEERMSRADLVIDNSGSAEQMQRQLADNWARLNDKG